MHGIEYSESRCLQGDCVRLVWCTLSTMCSLRGDHQAISPLSAGLFQHAIAQSGTAAMEILMTDQPEIVLQVIICKEVNYMHVKGAVCTFCKFSSFIFWQPYIPHLLNVYVCVCVCVYVCSVHTCIFMITTGTHSVLF